MNGEFLRGEVYWVSVDDSIGTEIRTGRTAVIVSGDGRNKSFPKVIIAYTTSAESVVSDPLRVKVNIGGRLCRVLCDELRTIDKQRITKYVTTLTQEEMTRVTSALACAQCIPIQPNTTKKKDSIVDTEELLSLRVELETMRKMYEKVLDELVEFRIARDLAERAVVGKVVEDVVEDVVAVEDAVEAVVEDVVEDVVEEPAPEPEPEPEPEPPKAEINTCSLGELRACGCTHQIAESIIHCRPYRSVEDLKAVPQLTRMAYAILSNKVCCVPVEKKPPIVVEVPETAPEKDSGKVNINTLGTNEIMEALGCPRSYGGFIVTHRNRNGKFHSLEELLDVKYLPKCFLEKHRDRLTIGDEESEEEPASEEKPSKEVTRLDINTASTRDFMAVGFGKRVAALIVSERKKFGNYRSVDDLAEIDGVSGKILRKLKDVLYVGDSGAKPYYLTSGGK